VRIRRGPATVTGKQTPSVVTAPNGLEGRGARRSGSQDTPAVAIVNWGADPGGTAWKTTGCAR
jgi:hypothetical protein